MSEPTPNWRILVVDDSLTIRRALEFILKPQGYGLEFAADGAEALARAAEFDPDLILLDYVLPDMRGPDVCEALAANPVTAATPVILVSAKGASIRQTYQDTPNVVSYVTKPFKQQVVLSVVQNALARGRIAGGSPTVAAETRTPVAGETRPRAVPDLAAHGQHPARASGFDGASAPQAGTLPRDVEAGLALLLEQVEEAFAGIGTVASIASLWPSLRGAARTGRTAPTPGDMTQRLRLAAARCAELERHLAGPELGAAPMLGWRWLPDGSLGSVLDALVDTHAAVCRAVVSLCAAGAGDPPTTASPRLIVVEIGAPDEVASLRDLVGAAMRGLAGPDSGDPRPEAEAPEMLTLRGEPAQLPHLVALLKPAAVLAPRTTDGPVAEALQRARRVGGATKYLTHDPAGASQPASATSSSDVVGNAGDLELVLREIVAADGAGREAADGVDPLAGPVPMVLA